MAGIAVSSVEASAKVARPVLAKEVVTQASSSAAAIGRQMARIAGSTLRGGEGAVRGAATITGVSTTTGPTACGGTAAASMAAGAFRVCEVTGTVERASVGA